MNGRDEKPGQGGLKRSPEATLTSLLWSPRPGRLGFNSQSGKGLRPKAEDKGSKANADKIPRGAEEPRNEVVVEGVWRDRRRRGQCQHKGKGTTARTRHCHHRHRHYGYTSEPPCEVY